MRRPNLSLTMLCAVAMLAACGDGIDERGDVGGAPLTAESTEPADTAAPAPPLPRPTVAAERTRVISPNPDYTVDYSGAHSVVHLADGTWILSGFDNYSDALQPERGAVWRSDDLHTWERVGTDISDPDDQQTIAQFVAVDDTVIAMGADLSDAIVSLADAEAIAWTSDDHGDHFTRRTVQRGAWISGAKVIDGTIWAWGAAFDGDRVHGQIWTSDDEGHSWTALDPRASPAPGQPVSPLGPIDDLVEWDGSLVAVGITTVTDPDGASDRLDADSMLQLGSRRAVDVGLWYSDDDGSHWAAAAPAGLAGVESAQEVSRAAVVNDHLVLVGGSGASIDGNGNATGNGSGRWTPMVWTCDHALQRCAARTTYSLPLDFTSSTSAAAGDIAVLAVRGIVENVPNQISVVGFLDPITNHLSATKVSGDIEQIEAIEVVDGTAYLFGRNLESNLLQVATVALPD